MVIGFIKVVIRFIAVGVMSLLLASVVVIADGGGSWDNKSKDKNFEKGVMAIESANYNEALELFNKVVTDKPEDADAWNYIGFSNRKLKQYDEALLAYQKALDIDPKHRGANEYLGELYLQTDNLPKAKERLERLDSLCFFGCDEYDKLEAAIAAYEKQ